MKFARMFLCMYIPQKVYIWTGVFFSQIINLERRLHSRTMDVEMTRIDVRTVISASLLTYGHLYSFVPYIHTHTHTHTHTRTHTHTHTHTQADTQMRWKEDQLQEGVSRQLKLMATEKKLRETVSENDDELRNLRQLLDRERSDGGRKEREVTRLTTELGEANKTRSELEKKVHNDISE